MSLWRYRVSPLHTEMSASISLISLFCLLLSTVCARPQTDFDNSLMWYDSDDANLRNFELGMGSLYAQQQKRWANQVRFGKRASWASSVRFG